MLRLVHTQESFLTTVQDRANTVLQVPPENAGETVKKAEQLAEKLVSEFLATPYRHKLLQMSIKLRSELCSFIRTKEQAIQLRNTLRDLCIKHARKADKNSVAYLTDLFFARLYHKLIDFHVRGELLEHAKNDDEYHDAIKLLVLIHNTNQIIIMRQEIENEPGFDLLCHGVYITEYFFGGFAISPRGIKIIESFNLER